MKFLLVIFSLLLLCLPALAEKRSHKAHVHGKGTFTLAIERHALEIEMEIPADDIVGFEHAATTKVQKQQVKRAEDELKQADTMVLLPKEARCKATAIDVQSSLSEEEGDHHHEAEEETHAEFHVVYKFRCEAPRYLNRVTLNIFQTFSSLQALNSQAVTMDGQFSTELTPRKNTFQFFK